MELAAAVADQGVSTICVGRLMLGTKEEEARLKFPNSGNRREPTCNPHESLTAQKNLCLSRATAVRCSLLIMPDERSDAVRRLDIN